MLQITQQMHSNIIANAGHSWDLVIFQLGFWTNLGKKKNLHMINFLNTPLHWAHIKPPTNPQKTKQKKTLLPKFIDSAHFVKYFLSPNSEKCLREMTKCLE